MTKNRYFVITGIVVYSFGGCFHLSAAQKPQDPIYFKWTGDKERAINVTARLQDSATQTVLAEKTLTPGQAITYDSSIPVSLYLKKDDFFGRLMTGWTGPHVLEPNKQYYGRYNDPEFEYITNCDPSFKNCPHSDKTSLALH